MPNCLPFFIYLLPISTFMPLLGVSFLLGMSPSTSTNPNLTTSPEAELKSKCPGRFLASAGSHEFFIDFVVNIYCSDHVLSFYEHISYLIRPTSANYSTRNEMWPTACFCKWSFIWTQLCSFFYTSSVAAFGVQRQSWVVATETTWPTRPRVFSIWLFTVSLLILKYSQLPEWTIRMI